MFSNNKLSSVFSPLVIVAFVISGCTSAVKADQPLTTEPVEVSHGNEIGGYVDLVDALRGTGAEVEPVEEVQQPFIDTSGQIIKVNDADVQVFEFTDEATRKAASDQISPDGSSTGTTMITWIDQPIFWARGRIIVLYVGKDVTTIDLLSDVMGAPITTHE
jgi:hypothetical protein